MKYEARPLTGSQVSATKDEKGQGAQPRTSTPIGRKFRKSRSKRYKREDDEIECNCGFPFCILEVTALLEEYSIVDKETGWSVEPWMRDKLTSFV
jgi:hypothetical protein